MLSPAYNNHTHRYIVRSYPIPLTLFQNSSDIQAGSSILYLFYKHFTIFIFYAYFILFSGQQQQRLGGLA